LSKARAYSRPRDYRRNRVSGGTFFFTVNPLGRRSDLSVMQVETLRDPVRGVRGKGGASSLKKADAGIR
jgi:hypothetical protein